ncbi:putative thermostable hemolysin [Variovorax paradoxus B4]|uniref:Putative thermostable hemolysin n=1 Tax=Variovorax paradoxus B4 TaxID=1246301 RepID=T1XJ44_VARPD|nr:thermostable hemolysin [Variovorax paradoxus]AGU52917.1 putative thermostable hemolysin [Variovorax paradoxus B4]
MFMSLSSRTRMVEPPAGVPVTPPAEFTVHEHHDPRRAAVEDFIRGIYAHRYGAQVTHFAPRLVSLRRNGELVAAAGYRNAAHGALFLEHYLSSPVEVLLAGCAPGRPARENIVEVGHLAASRAGEGRQLIQWLAPHLAAEGFEWIVGTVTQELRKMLVRLGVVPLTLGAANASALGAEAVRWGSYYDHQPVVLASHLRLALRRHMARRSTASGAQQ